MHLNTQVTVTKISYRLRITLISLRTATNILVRVVKTIHEKDNFITQFYSKYGLAVATSDTRFGNMVILLVYWITTTNIFLLKQEG